MLIVSYLLILAWQKDYGDAPIPSQSVAPVHTQDIPASNINNDLPQQSLPIPVYENQADALIVVDTSNYKIKINPIGGDIVYAALKKHTDTLHGDKPFVMLTDDGRTYTAQSLVVSDIGDSNASRAHYYSAQSSYTMQGDSLSVPLHYEKDGVVINKTYTFYRDKYPITVSHQIINQSQHPWQGQLFMQLKRDLSDDPGLSGKGMIGVATYLGGAYGTPSEPYNKLKFSKFNANSPDVSSKDGWVGIVQHYFVSAWTPNDYAGRLFSRAQDGINYIGYSSPAINVASGKQITLSDTLYIGPKTQSELNEVAKGLNQSVDYGILWPISKLFFVLLDGIHKALGNWGWSIIVLTIIIKIMLMWFSNKSYYSMAKMRLLAPKLQALKEQYGDDRMRLSQEMMKLYKDEKANPMAGCLPMLLQMPIFLALYWMLVESVELRHAPWILWIKDLSAMDPWFVLPIFMGATMFIQQQLNPQPSDPMQAKMMKVLPLIFAAFMLFFPAGLVLYWIVNNLFSMIQQYIINQKVEKERKKAQVVTLNK